MVARIVSEAWRSAVRPSHFQRPRQLSSIQPVWLHKDGRCAFVRKIDTQAVGHICCVVSWKFCFLHATSRAEGDLKEV